MKQFIFTKKIAVLFIAAAVILMSCNTAPKSNSLTTKTLPEKFVFVALPDTQLYAQYSPEIFESQTQWIVDNAEKEGIKYVVHLGDIVNKHYDLRQWDRASKAMTILENAGMNYAAVTGNHDIDNRVIYDNMRTDIENYPKYFPVSRFAAMSTFGGATENGFNMYHFVQCGDYTIMVLALDWYPSDETLAWAEKVLDENKNCPTIVVKHSLIKPRKTLKDNGGNVRFSTDRCPEHWEILSKHDNVIFTINGHHTGSDYGILPNEYGNNVFLTCADYQGKTNGGNGWMRILEFDFENGLIKGKTYSPYVDSIPEDERGEKDLVYLEDEMNTYSVSFDLKARFESIGRQ